MTMLMMMMMSQQIACMHGLMQRICSVELVVAGGIPFRVILADFRGWRRYDIAGTTILV